MRQPSKYTPFPGRATAAWGLVCACLLTIVAGIPPASASQADSTFLAQTAAVKLPPGAYRWNSPVALNGPMTMVVDLSSQMAFVYLSGEIIGITTVSSGKPGYETPTGNFTVLQKERMHHSNLYDDAPMPFMQRLAWSGLALHAGRVRGYPASHGCVRLPMGFAAVLFKENTRGMHVVITGHAPSKEEIIMASRQTAPANAQISDKAAAGADYNNVSDETAQPSDDEYNSVPQQGHADSDNPPVTPLQAVLPSPD